MRWKKLHIGVDDQGWIIASSVTDGHAQDPSQVPALLVRIERELERFIGDGICDQDPVYTAVEAHSPPTSPLDFTLSSLRYHLPGVPLRS